MDGGSEDWKVSFGCPGFEIFRFADVCSSRSDHQLHAQASLPYFPIPIRINLEVSPFIPMKPFPQPPDVRGLDLTHPAYKLSEATPNLRLRDQFIWNLYETMITPDQVALSIVHELDLPQPAQMMANISGQIRSQLEEYAGIALHPLFSSIPTNPNGASSKAAIQPKVESNAATPSAATLMTNGNTVVNGTNGNVSPPKAQNGVTSSATLIPTEDSEDYHPDDAYRCIVSLNINMMKKVYTDKFEWSLLHPPGMAEKFSRQTCADMGLGGEWVPVMAHAIYEAVLRLKREACESGSIGGSGFGGEIENLALEGREAGWRFDNESLADEWEPKVEVLSKEEIEKREYDRERQIRRMRRETARFSSNAGMTGMGQTGYFDSPQDETFGRGERSKKRRRARSLSPLGTSGTPGGRGTPEVGGRESSTLTDQERSNWRCSHCRAWGNSVWGIRDGPRGPRVSLDSFSSTPLAYADSKICSRSVRAVATPMSVIGSSRLAWKICISTTPCLGYSDGGFVGGRLS
jgi:chromatin structure-remodeling complex subunit SFH1